MALSFLNMFKKEDTEAESAAAQQVDPNENADANQGEAESKGKHGEDYCCGSCS